jgi:starch synthase (maltosyl-transferring)
VTDEQLIAHSKSSEDSGDAVQVVVDLDPFDAQAGRLELPLGEFRLAASRPYQMHELPSGRHYTGHGSENLVPLDPQGVAAHVSRLRRRVRSERDLTYLM